MTFHPTLAAAAGINPPAGDIGGTAASPTVVSTHLSSPLPVSQGGTGTTTGALVSAWASVLQAPTGALWEVWPRQLITATNGSFASGDVYLQSIGLPAGVVVANISVLIGGTAGNTLSHGWFCLTDSTYKVQAVSADQTSGNWTANTIKTLAMAASYTIPTSGIYYIGVMAVASQQPSTFSSGSVVPTSLTVNPPLYGLSSTGQTTPPTAGTTTLATPSPSTGLEFYAYTS